MSVKKRLLKQTIKFENNSRYTTGLQYNNASQQNQSLVPFDIAASVESELLAQKEANRKARNKRKANKK